MSSIPVPELYKHRDLLAAWSMRIIRARYQQSVLGGLWAILQPLATVTIFSIIFSYFIPVDTGNIPYPIFSYTAMVPWLLFSTSLADMVESVVTNMNIVGKIFFPREILVIAALLARTLDFFIAYTLLIVLMLYYGMPVFQMSWLYMPLILFVQMALALGLGLIGAALNVFYRDVRHLITLIIQLWFYATPIIYPITVVPEQFQTLYFLNPMAGVIEAYRSVMLYGTAPDNTFILSSVVAFVILLVGYWFFKRVEFKFADVI
jgi:lipopolysaccharide transport system permease protein